MDDLVSELRAIANMERSASARILDSAADRIEALEAAIIYAAETTTDKHTSRKLFAALTPSQPDDGE